MKQERVDKIKEITEKLNQGIQELYQSDRYVDFLRVMSKFHSYSANNCMLIAMQRPDATAVAGYRTWETKFNRHVKKGSTGIAILEPAPWKKLVRQTLLDEIGNPLLGPDGEVMVQEVEHTVQGFKIGHVFAYEDTEGEPLPTMVDIVSQEVKDYDRTMEILQKVSPVPIYLHEISGGANGYFNHMSRDIHVRNDLPQGQTVKTTIHEIAHSLLHDKATGEDPNANRREREVCAESVAFIVCDYMGLDTSSYSFGYIGGWSQGHELKELQSKMELIRRTANTIIAGIEAEVLCRRESIDITHAETLNPISPQPIQVIQDTPKRHHRHRR